MRRTVLVCILIAGATIAAYWPAMGYDFVDLDDLFNVKNNPNVTGGVTMNSIYWAFTTDYADYWHPLTWISFMVDAQFWGDDARGYHITNIALHVINSMLVLGVLSNLTGAFWRSALVAGWFALHPTHVESVAWITERKDVLSMMFWLLTMWAYTRQVRSSGSSRTVWFMVTTTLLSLGLMSKPIVVTLPCVLLLLDVWPLGRIKWPASRGEIGRFLGDVRDMFMEKILFFVLAGISAYITFLHGSRSVWEVPLSARLVNAVTAYVCYVEKTIWPLDLCVYYPYPGMFGQPAWPMWFVSMCAATLVAVTVTAVLIARRCGYFFTGWFWFLGTLVPVIGLVQVSFQSMADRFAYFPHIGLFVLIAWLLTDATKHFRVPRAIVVSAALASIAACGWLTAQQVRTWHDSETLYRHALVTCPKNWKVNHYLGDYLYYQDQFEASLAQYQAAIALKPDDASALFKAGVVLRDLNRYTEAAESLDKSIQLDPIQGDAHFNLAFVLSRLARTGEARALLREAVRLQPEQVDRNISLAAEIEAGTSR
jgi:hypothetical protein